MTRKGLQKGIAILCSAILMGSSLVGCSSTADSTSLSQSVAETSSTAVEENTPLFSDPVTLSMFTSGNPSWPFQDDWYVMDLIKEYTNVDLDVNAVDGSGYYEKLSLLMASGELPDLMYFPENTAVQQYASQGAFINIYDYIDQMPNFKAWYEKNKQYATMYLSADGGLYQFPQQGVEEANRGGWMYRADVFEELGLTQPTNKEEFYDTLVKLKEAYPDSYPLAIRSFFARLDWIAESWNTYYMNGPENRFFGYDYNTEEWKFGPTSPEFKEMLEYFNKLYTEELLLPNFLSIDTKGWQDIMANSDSFITIDYLSRIDFFNNSMRESDPDFTLDYLVPPAFSEESGNNLGYTAKVLGGFSIFSKTKHLDEALAYIDWMYSDEAKDVLSWGRPGELYNVDSTGNRSWKDFKTSAEMRQSTGMETFGFYLLYDFNGEFSTYTPECRAATEEARKHDRQQQPILAYTDEEQSVVSTVGTNISTFVDEQISKFILGERSFDEWDDYVAEVESLGLEQLKAVHESSYARVLEAQQQ